ncbi:MAG: alpha/beta hydrolase, partial [Actinobacteria bacterium]|nr:alpha/beta hydrolase [Actinomycetota bacterium]
LHLPAGALIGGVVVCPSLFNDFQKNYRREVVLARSLSAHGIAVARFHYRGTGNSDGDPLDMSFESLCQDALAAAAHLRERTGLRKLAFLATRFGALVASSAAATTAEAFPLALLEPVIQADQFFADGLRIKLYIQGIRRTSQSAGQSTEPSVKALLNEMERTGWLDMVGYTCSRQLYRSSSGRTVQGELGNVPRPVLLAQLGADVPLRPVLQSTAATLSGRGFIVDVDRLGSREQWWLPEEVDWRPGAADSLPHGWADRQQVAAALAGWLRQQLAPVP